MKDVLKHTASMLGTLGTGLVIAAFFQQGGVNLGGVCSGVWLMFVSGVVAWWSTDYE